MTPVAAVADRGAHHTHVGALMMTWDEFRQKAVASRVVWNGRDLDAIMRHYAEDVAFSPRRGVVDAERTPRDL